MANKLKYTGDTISDDRISVEKIHDRDARRSALPYTLDLLRQCEDIFVQDEN